MSDTREGAEISKELKCQACGGNNVVWFAQNKLWNTVMGSPNGIVCPSCFIIEAEKRGVVDDVWQVIPQTAYKKALRDAESAALERAAALAQEYVHTDNGDQHRTACWIRDGIRAMKEQDDER
jgi:hypothetical protein